MSIRILLSRIAIVFSLVCVTACGKFDKTLDDNVDPDILSHLFEKKDEKIKVVDVEFATDYKTFTVSTDVEHDVGYHELKDSTKVRVEVKETIEGVGMARFTTPRLKEIKNIEAESVSQLGIKMLVLIDRTLPQSNLDALRSLVLEMKTTFTGDNLYVAFMDSNSVSESMLASDYVLDNYFVKSRSNHVCLYRSILQKSQEMLQRDNCWMDATKLVLLTFSNEKVYQDGSDEPLDPNHFLFQEQLTDRDFELDDTSFVAYYASMNTLQNGDDDYAKNILRIFCTNTGGQYIDNFNWVSFKRDMYRTLNIITPDNEFLFENPDNKVYRGDNKRLMVSFYDIKADTLMASFTASINKGEMFDPIIVNEQPFHHIIIQGIILGIFLIALVYLAIQIIVPFVSYCIFRRRYVVKYTGRGMCFDSKPVGECCYLCKAPFEKGDDIVVKCEHTTHKTCWDENSYHCPEYSDRCKHGSHYYNVHKIHDPRNAPYYLKWLLVAIAASVFSWLIFLMYVHFDYYSNLYPFAHSSVTQPPFLGLSIAFFLTLGLSALALRRRTNIRAALSVTLRAVIAAVGCYLSFMVINLIIFIFNINNYTFLINWIPWTLSGFIIAACTTFATSIRHSRWILLASVLVGFLSMYAWNTLFCFFELDFRLFTLLSFVIYCIGLALAIAVAAPRSERYFLKVQGAVKTMDIALYKWFRNNPDRVVTIGKSVDCSLQLSWDLQGEVAPVQAEIRMRKRSPYLIPIEPGVYMRGKKLRVNKKYRLFHGRTFTIGQTNFTYVEKDR